MLFIVNDHLDIALAVNADGVHLGQEDLPVAVARKLAPDLLIGASSHSVNQALQAEQEGADYVNVGPIFATGTKAATVQPLGVEAIELIGGKLNVPYTVMGGITAANLNEVLARGARRIAVVTAITMAADIAATVQALRFRIRTYSRVFSCPLLALQ